MNFLRPEAAGAVQPDDARLGFSSRRKTNFVIWKQRCTGSALFHFSGGRSALANYGSLWRSMTLLYNHRPNKKNKEKNLLHFASSVFLLPFSLLRLITSTVLSLTLCQEEQSTAKRRNYSFSYKLPLHLLVRGRRSPLSEGVFPVSAPS